MRIARSTIAALVLGALAASPVAAQQDQSVLFPLPEVEGALEWQTLAGVEFVPEGEAMRVAFTDAVRALDGQTVKMVGFLLPLDGAGRRQLLTRTSPHCPFCLPVGPEGMVEVECAEPVGFIQRAVVVEGRFEVVDDATEGRVYRMTEVDLLDE